MLFAAATTVTVCALTLTGCGSGSGSSGKDGGKVKVGLITKTDTNPFFVKMREGAQKEAKQKGVELTTAAGKYDGDNAGQVTALENMVSAGVKGILITPNDSKAIVPALAKARAKGVLVIALDTPPEPQSAADALFATDNVKAGKLIGAYAKAAMQGKEAKIATMDLSPGVSVGVQRHQGFMEGYGITDKDSALVCSQDTGGDRAKGQTAMENCLQKAPDINLVYAINEPAALGAYTAIKAKGRAKDVMIVTIDGGCEGVAAVKDGRIAATSQQYPLKMAADGVAAIVDYAKTGKKVSGYTDTGVQLIADQAQPGVDSKDAGFGIDNCWGK
ncbi:sugar ABC transporter substrate-binding protein [Streptomyces sp. NPDC048567]|uniref:sugar ABC transporter substrate-binding protein n=1 Tax=Streptomyces sp. NPDC048567 TaxID=3365570 RepID=UPI00371441D9